jgi:hypothetical protein
MKIIAIGDTHGRDLWKKVINQDFDKFIFIGDYFDSREGISSSIQIENFKEILEFKNNNIDKVELLIGNHDYHYLKGVKEQYSNFDIRSANLIYDVLQPAIDSNLLKMCYVYKDYVFTHAGVTKTWANQNEIDVDNLQDSINNIFVDNIEAFSFNGFVRSGDNITQSPIWVRLPSLFEDSLDDYIFVVGHSTLKELTITDNIIGIDTIATSGEYLIINDDVVSVGKIDN